MSLRIGIGDVYQYQIPLFLSSVLSRYIVDFIGLVSKYHIQVQELEYSVICHAFPMMHRYACHVSVFIEIIIIANSQHVHESHMLYNRTLIKLLHGVQIYPRGFVFSCKHDLCDIVI